MKKTGLLLLLLALLVTGSAAAQTPVTEVPARTLAVIRLRIAPGQENLELVTLPYRTPVIIEARNNIGNWLLVRTEAGVRGWAAARFIGWDPDIDLALFPVSGEVFGDNPASAGPPVAVAVPEVAPATPPPGEPGTVLARLNVRAAPEATAPVINRLEFRSAVFIEARNGIGNWLLVTSADAAVRGWVASRFIEWEAEVLLSSFPVSGEVFGGFDPAAATQSAAAPAATAAVPLVGGRLADGSVPGRALVQNLNVRRSPAATAEPLGQMSLNTRVIIEARNFIGDWLLIRTEDGRLRGWVASRFIGWSAEIDLATFAISGEEMGQ
ncbi:MAG: SH3 domain-containing protein [Anaerolineae bacterium]|nr:SH3 domain-containing protein [Anaerolineae bacterium]